MRDRANPESIVDDWLGILIALGIFFVYSFFVEPELLTVKQVQINDTGLDLKIVFISDFQRWDSDPSFIQRAIDLANREEPDIILLGGDYIERDLSELPSVEPLKSLHAKYGIYGVLGNHDYGMITGTESAPDTSMASDVESFLEDGGIRILRNEHINTANLTIIGLDDLWAGERDTAAISSDDMSDYRILLSHNQYDLPIGNDTADLYLFGHTHCGQLRLPGIGSLPKLIGFKGEYEMGRYSINGSDVYTTCGLAWGPRFLAQPEITVIELN